MSEHWTILAPGPSLWEMDAIEAPGPVVAVKLAIEHPTPADYWCVNDPLETFERILEGKDWMECNAGPTVWSLRPAGFSERGFKVSPTGGRQWFWKYLPHRVKGECYINITMASALGRVLMHDPTEVTIYGADMDGDNYGKEWYPVGNHQKRWGWERRQIHNIADDFSRLMGININFVRKEPAFG